MGLRNWMAEALAKQDDIAMPVVRLSPWAIDLCDEIQLAKDCLEPF